MSPPLPHVYGRIKLEEDAFISCHNCDFTSYTFKGFSLHLRKVHGLSLTGKPPRRNKPRPPKTVPVVAGTSGEDISSSGSVSMATLQLSDGLNSSAAGSQATTPDAAVETAGREPPGPAAAAAASSSAAHVETVKRLVAKREAARVRRAVRRGLRMRPSYGSGPGQVEVSFACDRCNFTATCRKQFQSHVMQRTCH